MAYPVIGRCPVCGEAMELVQLHCRHCDTRIQGHFYLGRFDRLSSDQLAFAETFIRLEGKINRVGEELRISYPTVRNRLMDVIKALGYEVEEDSGLSQQDRQEILERLAAGDITSDQAVKLLQDK